MKIHFLPQFLCFVILFIVPCSLAIGATPEQRLHSAIQLGDTEQARSVIYQGVAVNTFADGQNVFLSHAARLQSAEIVRLLFQSGARPGTDGSRKAQLTCHDGGNSGQNFENILNYAISDLETVRVLLEGGTNPNVVSYCGSYAEKYPLVEAVKGFPEQVELSTIRTLLNFGASPNRHKDEPLETPLLLAVEASEPEVVRMLVNAGAEANVLPVKRSRACRNIGDYQTALDKALAMKYSGQQGEKRRKAEAVVQTLRNAGGQELSVLCSY